MPKLIRVMEATIRYIEIGEANSYSPAYWAKDFRLKLKKQMGETTITLIEDLRELTPSEEALSAEPVINYRSPIKDE